MQAKIQFNCVISPYPAQKIVNLPLFKMNMELKEHFNNKIFKLISETADELGVECYVVGGYVRDIFLARPSKDIDVVVVGSGIEMAQAFGKKLGRGAHVSVLRISARHKLNTMTRKWNLSVPVKSRTAMTAVSP